MIRKRLLHSISLGLICVLPVSLYGCSKKTISSSTKSTQAASSDSAPKGRYLEQDITLPELDDHSTLNGMIADGTFTKETPEWLQNIDIDPSLEHSFTLQTGPEGSQYLLVNDYSPNTGHSTLYITTDQKTKSAIPMQG